MVYVQLYIYHNSIENTQKLLHQYCVAQYKFTCQQVVPLSSAVFLIQRRCFGDTVIRMISFMIVHAYHDNYVIYIRRFFAIHLSLFSTVSTGIMILVLVLVVVQEGSIASIVHVLRCDQSYLLITQGVFLRAMVAPGTCTFVRPQRHKAYLQILFAQKNTPVDRPGLEPLTF